MSPEESAYDILSSPIFAYGFLPPTLASSRLPDAWTPWEDALLEAAKTLGSDTLSTLKGTPVALEWRESIEKLPVLSTEALRADIPNLLRARQVLTFLLHYYIHCIPRPADSPPLHIPPSISIPLHPISEWVGLPPICTYSDATYYNFSYVQRAEAGSALDMELHFTFTSSSDEVHFHGTQLLIERRGADVTRVMHSVIEEIRRPSETSASLVSAQLDQLASIVREMTRILINVRIDCRPPFFFNQIRPWLGGGSLIFDGTGDTEAVELAGVSAGQSSIIHALDAFLGIDELTHCSDGYEAGTSGVAVSFLTRMRAYIPAEHRVVIEGLSGLGKSLRAFIVDSSSSETPSAAILYYNSVINALKDFRTEHIKVATLYVVSQKKGGKSMGTGGTELVPFLRGVRDQTGQGLL